VGINGLQLQLLRWFLEYLKEVVINGSTAYWSISGLRGTQDRLSKVDDLINKYAEKNNRLPIGLISDKEYELSDIAGGDAQTLLRVITIPINKDEEFNKEWERLYGN
jgi:hypothetical protein